MIMIIDSYVLSFSLGFLTKLLNKILYPKLTVWTASILVISKATVNKFKPSQMAMRYIKSKRVAASISFDKIINKTVIQDVERTPSETERAC